MRRPMRGSLAWTAPKHTTANRHVPTRSSAVASCPCVSLLVIDRLRIEHLPAHRLPLPFGLVLAKEATVIPLMARGPDLLHLDQQHVLVTVGAHALHVLHVPAALPLEPQLV